MSMQLSVLIQAQVTSENQKGELTQMTKLTLLYNFKTCGEG